jgi:N-acetylmuramoyl-L-alanine amidase
MSSLSSEFSSYPANSLPSNNSPELNLGIDPIDPFSPKPQSPSPLSNPDLVSQSGATFSPSIDDPILPGSAGVTGALNGGDVPYPDVISADDDPLLGKTDEATAPDLPTPDPLTDGVLSQTTGSLELDRPANPQPNERSVIDENLPDSIDASTEDGTTGAVGDSPDDTVDELPVEIQPIAGDDSTDGTATDDINIEDVEIDTDIPVAIDSQPSSPIGTIPELIPGAKGVFTVGSDGLINIDILNENSPLDFTIALISLEGMETFYSDRQAFQAEAARRALSGSELGHIILSDPIDGGRFTNSRYGHNDNTGTYRGVQTFSMRPGDKIAIVAVPNGTMEEFAERLERGGHPRFICSIPSLNDNGDPQFAHLKASTGDGSIITMEDYQFEDKEHRDFNDAIFQIRGVTGQLPVLSDLIDTAKGWWSQMLGKAIMDYGDPYLTPVEDPLEEPTDSGESFKFPAKNQPFIGIIDTGLAVNNPDIDYGKITLGTDQVEGDNDPLLQPGEGSQHGTHVTGIIAAKQGNSFGIDGMNPDAPLWIGRATDSGKWAQSLTEFVDAAIASGQPNAIVYLGFDLTQISANGTESTRFELTPEEREALEYARQKGILIVVPAGNQGGGMSVLGQASREFNNIMTVGAAHNSDPTTSASQGFDRTNYSSYGRGLDIMAPGGTVSGGILSTVGSGMGTMAGTSVAAAYVAGGASQVWAANPDLNYLQVKNLLQLTATDLNVAGTDTQTGAGLLNIDAAVNLAKATAAEEYDPPDFLTPDTWGGDGIVTPDERAAEFRPESFTLRVWPEEGVNLRNSPNYDDRSSYNIPVGTYLEFDGWDYGTVSIDPVTNQPDALFYRTQYNGQTFWVPSIWIDGYPPSNPPLLPPDDGDDDNLPYSVSGEFWNIYTAQGGTGGIFGNPTSDRYAVNGGERQNFQGGAIVQSSNGTFPLFGGIGAHYLITEGGEAGRLGFPTSGEIGIGNGVIIQNFEKGRIVYGDGDTRTEMFDNPDPNPTSVTINGYTIDGTFYPVFQQYQETLGNPIEGVQTHASGATYQLFENGSIVSSQHGTFPLYGAIRQGYLNESGLNGWLGAPTSGEFVSSSGFIQQNFANGYIVWNGVDAIAYESPDAPVQPPPISHPTPISGISLLGKKISLDPGHGITNLGFDPGASGNGTTEATENLVQANIIAEYLRQRGADVTIIDEPLSLDQIGQRSAGSDAFVALHLNSFNNNTQGHEVYSHSSAPPADSALANAINSELDFTFPDAEIPNRGVKTADFAVLRNAPLSVPAALTEALFIDAPGMSRANVEQAAQAIARGIEKFLTGSTTDTGNTDGGNSYLDQPLLTQQGINYFVDRPQFYTTGNIFTQAAYGSNLVDGYSRTEGNCTWYAHGRVKELGGNPAALNSMSGNAYEWHDQISNGTQIVSSPQPGDIAQWTSNGQNHVAVVEAVHPNGTMTISESHYKSNWDGGGAGTLHSVRPIGINEPDRYIRVPRV